MAAYVLHATDDEIDAGLRSAGYDPDAVQFRMQLMLNELMRDSGEKETP